MTRGPLVVPEAGPPVNVTSGGTVSTVQLRVAGDGSSCPAASVARTANVCGPWASARRLRGDVQAANADASRLHANVTLSSFDVNAKLALADRTVPVGPEVIVVSGGVRSTVHVRVAGVGS